MTAIAMTTEFVVGLHHVGTNVTNQIRLTKNENNPRMIPQKDKHLQIEKQDKTYINNLLGVTLNIYFKSEKFKS